MISRSNFYQYVTNDNLTYDDYKQFNVTYNSINLPSEFDLGSNRKTSYNYDGSGKKLTMIYSPGTYYPTNTEYRGQFVHQSCNGTSSLKYIITPEGMLKNKGTNAVPIWEWNYNLTDHLGNVRAVFRPTATNGVEKLGHTNYLPFGLRMPYPYSSALASYYLYNGKELQGDGGLDLYDYGARFYDPALGRWHSVDPSADENGQEVASPYCYVGNNPILRIDPDGRIWDDQVNDQKIADRIQNGIKDRLSAENSNLESANKTVAKLEAKIAEKGSLRGLESRLSNAKDGIASIGATISDLHSSSQELTTMGSNDVSQKFTFNELPEGSSVGVTYKNNDIITMDIFGNANGVHEATHGYQIFKSGGITKSGKFDAEVSAYQRQFSFSPLSVQTIPSSGGTISYRSNINSYWVAGINDNGKYIYMPGFKK